MEEIQRIKIYPDFITAEEEENLLEELKALSWQEVRMHGITAKRRVVHFGMTYHYAERTARPTENPPGFINPLMARVSQILAIDKREIAEILLTQYPTSSGIGWHRDAPIFGDAIVGVSFLGPCVLKFRRKSGDKFVVLKYEIPPRSAYIFSGEARWVWQHSIPSHKSPRYSATFRTLSAQPRA